MFACAGDYAEAVDVGTAQDGAVLFGGFDCATWKYTGAKARLRPTGAGPALRVHDLTKGFTLHDADVASPDATAPGGTSNAALVANAQGVVLVRVKLTAGKGANGGTGATGANGSSQDPNPISAPGSTGDSADFPNCQDDSGGGDYQCQYGGGGGSRTCSDGQTSWGGQGGGELDRNDGWEDGSGSAGGRIGIVPGVTGLGGTSSGSPYKCTVGGMGASGTIGMVGTGARGTGSLGASGWLGLSGATGKNGSPGQGGGGGAAASEDTCINLYGYEDCGNVDGGGGGSAGGCGGGGGLGGVAGGASIALAVFSSSVVLIDCALVASDGGTGGAGGVGGPGQLGAMVGTRLCGLRGHGLRGGLGGTGGLGGPGGGGQGGHSLGIAFSGTAPVLTRTTVMFGAAGQGGPAGAGSATPTQQPYAGVGGVAAATLSQWSDQTVDNVPPSAVTVTASWTSCHDLHASWTTSTDDRPGAVTYTLCDGMAAGACAGGTGQSTLVQSTAVDLTINSPGDQFVSVVATDLSGNASAPSAEVKVPAFVDTTPPSTPTVSVYALSMTSLSVSVSGSTDDCSYQISYQFCVSTSATGCQGASATWQPSNGLTVDGLTPGTTYYVSGRAVDAAQNKSAVATGSASTVPRPTFSHDIVSFHPVDLQDVGLPCPGAGRRHPHQLRGLDDDERPGQYGEEAHLVRLDRAGRDRGVRQLHL